jgi:hypothetical protein
MFITLETSGYYMYRQVEHTQILRSAHKMCFKRISERTETECVYKLTFKYNSG